MKNDSAESIPDLPKWISGERPFTTLDGDELDEAAVAHGFRRKGKRNWVRRTADFVQLVNLQFSQWSPEDRYLNFALWPLVFGEPISITESKFPFRVRAENIAKDLSSLFLVAERFETLSALRQAHLSGHLRQAALTKELNRLLEEQ